MEKTQKQENKQSKKVKFIVVREFSGEKTSRKPSNNSLNGKPANTLKNGWNARQAEGIC